MKRTVRTTTKTKNDSKWMWAYCAAMAGFTTLSMAMGSVPMHSRVTDDTAIYQNLSEIRAAKQADLNFDSDIARLSAIEGRYNEKLPSLSQHPRLKGPMQRIAEQKYQYVGSRKAPVARD